MKVVIMAIIMEEAMGMIMAIEMASTMVQTTQIMEEIIKGTTIII